MANKMVAFVAALVCLSTIAALAQAESAAGSAVLTDLRDTDTQIARDELVTRIDRHYYPGRPLERRIEDYPERLESVREAQQDRLEQVQEAQRERSQHLRESQQERATTKRKLRKERAEQEREQRKHFEEQQREQHKNRQDQDREERKFLKETKREEHWAGNRHPGEKHRERRETPVGVRPQF